MIVFLERELRPQRAHKRLNQRQHFPGIDRFDKKLLRQRGGKVGKHVCILHLSCYPFSKLLACFSPIYFAYGFS
jgi:hypothetical protein